MPLSWAAHHPVQTPQLDIKVLQRPAHSWHSQSTDPPSCPPGFHSPLGFCAFFFFLMWTISKVFVEFVTILLLLFMFWFFGQEAWGTLSTCPGIKPTPPTWKGKVPWSARKSLVLHTCFFKRSIFPISFL